MSHDDPTAFARSWLGGVRAGQDAARLRLAQEEQARRQREAETEQARRQREEAAVREYLLNQWDQLNPAPPMPGPAFSPSGGIGPHVQEAVGPVVPGPSPRPGGFGPPIEAGMPPLGRAPTAVGYQPPHDGTFLPPPPPGMFPVAPLHLARRAGLENLPTGLIAGELDLARKTKQREAELAYEENTRARERMNKLAYLHHLYAGNPQALERALVENGIAETFDPQMQRRLFRDLDGRQEQEGQREAVAARLESYERFIAEQNPENLDPFRVGALRELIAQGHEPTPADMRALAKADSQDIERNRGVLARLKETLGDAINPTAFAAAEAAVDMGTPVGSQLLTQVIKPDQTVASATKAALERIAKDTEAQKREVIRKHEERIRAARLPYEQGVRDGLREKTLKPLRDALDAALAAQERDLAPIEAKGQRVFAETMEMYRELGADLGPFAPAPDPGAPGAPAGGETSAVQVDLPTMDEALDIALQRLEERRAATGTPFKPEDVVAMAEELILGRSER